MMSLQHGLDTILLKDVFEEKSMVSHVQRILHEWQCPMKLLQQAADEFLNFNM